MLKGITDIDEGTIRRIDWQELIPASMLVRAFSLSFCWSKIFLASVVFLLLFLGGILFGWMQTPLCESVYCPWPAMTLLQSPLQTQTPSPASCISGNGHCSSLLTKGGVLPELLYLALTAIIVSLMALAFARSSAVAIASSHRSSLPASFAYAFSHLRSLLGAICLPGIVIVLLDLIVAFLRPYIFGHGYGLIFSILVPPVITILTVLVSVLKLGLLVGLPLLVAAVATDKSDSFDAVSRMFSYIFQRPLHFIFYVLLAGLFGAIGLFLVLLVSQLALSSLLPNLVDSKFSFTHYASSTIGWTRFWIALIVLLPLGWLFTYSITAMTTIYFILRRSLDGTPIDICYQQDAHRPSRTLPSVQLDEQGAPILDSDISKTDNSKIGNDSVPQTGEVDSQGTPHAP